MKKAVNNAEYAGHLSDRIAGIRDYQEINYPILWGGQHERPVHRAGETPTPQ
ncbi:hypothetical protein H6G93_15710 [Nostoc sp. FACHB-973]|uniref:Uncharacterized protein n=1 Tax=Desmonostoc muscorum LEGE 12446 TaxID=1828758 RepID=A0A8J6ZX93_DESMC|nr:hypothetical protein [Desmonostoc muscorum]MBD2516434.1 hypothetical protein [Nostoc sp. FACHB-973]MBX9257952.1 hypothetical protein [Desmonostoc muscorum CCALA 125]